MRPMTRPCNSIENINSMPHRLPWLCILTMLLVMVTSLEAQTSATNTTSTHVPALTPQLMTKMLQLIAVSGSNRELAAEFAHPLGLTATGQSWPNRQVASYGIPSNFNHGFAVSRGSDQDVVLSLRTPDTIYVFRSDRHGASATALSCDVKNGNIITLNFVNARKALDNEIRFWAKNVDKLIQMKTHPELPKESEHSQQ